MLSFHGLQEPRLRSSSSRRRQHVAFQGISPCFSHTESRACSPGSQNFPRSLLAHLIEGESIKPISLVFAVLNETCSYGAMFLCHTDFACQVLSWSLTCHSRSVGFEFVLPLRRFTLCGPKFISWNQTGENIGWCVWNSTVLEDALWTLNCRGVFGHLQ